MAPPQKIRTRMNTCSSRIAHPARGNSVRSDLFITRDTAGVHLPLLLGGRGGRFLVPGSVGVRGNKTCKLRNRPKVSSALHSCSSYFNSLFAFPIRFPQVSHFRFQVSALALFLLCLLLPAVS